MVATFSRIFILVSLLLHASILSVRCVEAQESNDRTVSTLDIRNDLRAFSKRLNKAKTDMQRVDAVVDLGFLYLDVISNPRFFRSKVLQGRRGSIGYKLLQFAREVKNENRKKEKTRKERSQSDSEVTSIESDTQERQQTAVLQSVNDRHWQLLSRSFGSTGPTMYYGSGLQGTSGHFYRGRAGGIAGDNGRELLDLIQTVVHPDFWNINGGPGGAYYYQPLRILVVRATQRVHEDLENLLWRLRAQF